MAGEFQRAVDLMFGCAGRVVVTGMGKSGLIARKIAATLSSTGTSGAVSASGGGAARGFGDGGARGCRAGACRRRGETEEILALLATIKRLRVPLIAMTGDEICRNPQPVSQRVRDRDGARGERSKSKAAGESAAPHRPYPEQADVPTHTVSTLAAAADVALDCSIAQEACSLGLAPTASTTTMLALGDALAVTLSERRGFKEEDFANLHPGGKLGKRLARVESLMHTGDALPRVTPRRRCRT